MFKDEEIFLNSNEHTFDLSFSDNLMLRNYARLNKFNFCSMIGGAESIRDLQESKNIFADAFEFPMIESLFAIEKIFIALDKVFIKDNYSLKDKLIFINIASKNGLNLLENLYLPELPKFLNPRNVIFNFDRRSITRSFELANDENFEIETFEKEINTKIKKTLVFVKEKLFRFSISGGITSKSLNLIKEMDLFPDFIKTGMFTIKLLDKHDDIYKRIFELQCLEFKVISLMNKCIIYKHNYLNIRESHLKSYIKGKENE